MKTKNQRLTGPVRGFWTETVSNWEVLRGQRCTNRALSRKRQTSGCTAQHCTAPHSTAPHGRAGRNTAYHRTARQGTGGHGTARHYTALHDGAAVMSYFRLKGFPNDRVPYPKPSENWPYILLYDYLIVYLGRGMFHPVRAVSFFSPNISFLGEVLTSLEPPNPSLYYI